MTQCNRRALIEAALITPGVPSPAISATKPTVAHIEKDRPMSLLISVLVTFLVVILVLYLVNMLPVDGRAKQIIRIIVIIIGVLSLLRAIGGVGF